MDGWRLQKKGTKYVICRNLQIWRRKIVKYSNYMQDTCSIKTTLVCLAWGKNIPLLISVKSSYNRNLTVKEKRKSVVDHVSTSASYKKPHFPICRLFSWKITLSFDQDQAIQLIGVQQKISAAELEFFCRVWPEWQRLQAETKSTNKGIPSKDG